MAVSCCPWTRGGPSNGFVLLPACPPPPLSPLHPDTPGLAGTLALRLAKLRLFTQKDVDELEARLKPRPVLDAPGPPHTALFGGRGLRGRR